MAYKINGLTHSGTDFSTMVEVFGRHGRLFVSVTQQFNATTSMGRLGDADDNGLTECFLASLDGELIARRFWKTQTEARLAV